MARIPAGRAVLPGGRRVFVPGFWLDERPVSNADWRAYQRATGAASPPWIRRSGWDDPEQPVVGVTWREARAYARWRRRRLPTEAEWMRACGPAAWPWGDTEPHPKRAVFGCAANTPPARPGRDDGRGPWGHRDLVGNVWELVAEGFACGGFRGSTLPSPRDRLLLKPDEQSAGVSFRLAWR
jgi:formylglycine-generating enzyme required for sulfatase activity